MTSKAPFSAPYSAMRRSGSAKTLMARLAPILSAVGSGPSTTSVATISAAPAALAAMKGEGCRWGPSR